MSNESFMLSEMTSGKYKGYSRKKSLKTDFSLCVMFYQTKIITILEARTVKLAPSMNGTRPSTPSSKS